MFIDVIKIFLLGQRTSVRKDISEMFFWMFLRWNFLDISARLKRPVLGFLRKIFNLLVSRSKKLLGLFTCSNSRRARVSCLGMKEWG